MFAQFMFFLTINAAQTEQISFQGHTSQFSSDLSYVQTIRIEFLEQIQDTSEIGISPLFNGYDLAVGARWDDNCPNNLEMKKHLEPYGIKATWYLNVAAFENNLDAYSYLPTARELSKNGDSIGIHSYSHPYISYTSPNRAFREVMEARIVWETLLGIPVNSYSFSYVDLGNAEGKGLTSDDLFESLRRAGIINVAEFFGTHQKLAADMTLSVIMPPENADFETFRNAVEWAASCNEIKELHPCVSLSMHAWYGTYRSSFDWEELERRAQYISRIPKSWKCNHNEYGAYRLQYKFARIEELSRNDTSWTIRIRRPRLRALNDLVPLTIYVRGQQPTRVYCETAEVQASDNSVEGLYFYNIFHSTSERIPEEIAHLDTSDTTLEKIPSTIAFGFLSASLSYAHDGLTLKLANLGDETIEDLSVTWRVPLAYVQPPPVRVPAVERHHTWAHNISLQRYRLDPIYSVGELYFVAELNFSCLGKEYRCYVTNVHDVEIPDSFPRDHFAVMGPIPPAEFNVDTFINTLNTQGIPQELHLSDGTVVSWHNNHTEGEIPQTYLHPETIRTTGSWYINNPPVYLLWSHVWSPIEQEVKILCEEDNIICLYLNGEARKDFSGILHEGKNDLLIGYHPTRIMGSPQNAACFLRLAEKELANRLANIRYSNPLQNRSESLPPRTLRIALLQMNPSANNQEDNLRKADEFCRQAAALGADIALFPEMFNIGYTPFQGTDLETIRKWQTQAIDAESNYVKHLQALSKELQLIIGATYLERGQNAPRNSFSLIDRDGNIVFTYAKVHTCDFSNFEAVTTPGDDFYTANVKTRVGEICIGAMICFDREFPESARILMLKGAEIVLVPNACQLDDTRLHQFQSRALENSVAVFMTNYPAPLHGGRSVAYGPNGECLVLAGNEEGVFLAEIDIDYLRSYREKTIWGNAFRRPHKYQKLVDLSVDPIWKRKNGLNEDFLRERR